MRSTIGGQLARRDVARMNIRRLTDADTADFRAIRLEGLERHPTAFGASYEQEAAENLTFFAKRLKDSTVFGGFNGTALHGIAGFYPHGPGKESHKGVLSGMYVRDQARGTGLARALVESVLEHAKKHVEIIQLTVVVGNEAAHRLYTRCGFEGYGIAPRSLKVKGEYHDETLMQRRLV